MAMATKNNKWCGSCSYWAGNRKTSPGKEMAIMDNNEKGKCTHNSGPFKNINVIWSSKCSEWEGWNQLK